MRIRLAAGLLGLTLMVTPVLAPAAASAQQSPRVPVPDRLLPGESINASSALFSQSSTYRLQIVGGIVGLSFGCNHILWSPRASGVESIRYSKHGLVKLLDAQGGLVRSLGQRQDAPRHLVLQNDGNLVATGTDGVSFQTGTHSPPVSGAHGAAPRCLVTVNR